jgi:hypothetical protein
LGFVREKDRMTHIVMADHYNTLADRCERAEAELAEARAALDYVRRARLQELRWTRDMRERYFSHENRRCAADEVEELTLWAEIRISADLDVERAAAKAKAQEGAAK